MMRCVKRYIFPTLFLILGAVAVVAQEDRPDGCHLEALSADMIVYGDKLLELPLDEVEVILQEMDATISQVRAACSGYSFNSDDEGMQPVIGPLDFEAGTWIVTYTSKDYGIVELTAIDGDCGGYDSEFTLISVSAGEADRGAEEVLQTPEDCSALIQISNVSEGWTLEFELVKAG